MIIILKKGTTDTQSARLADWLSKFHVKIVPIVGEGTTIWGLVGDTAALDLETVTVNEAVESVMRVQEPYKLANRKFNSKNSEIRIGDSVIGSSEVVIMAGPCSVESDTQLMGAAQAVRASGAAVLRGGAFKPRSSPYAFQGLKTEGLVLLKKAREATGLPVVSEITSPYYLEVFEEYVDVVQVGARNMQNFELLKELGRLSKTVLLKRGFSNTLEELLMSAEYIMNAGNEQVILCERGIRTFETYTRNTLDVSAVPALKRMTHLPVIIDPSHAAGKAWMVEPLALAAVAVGADGLEVEVHPDPACALSDGAQSLTPSQFDHLMNAIRPVAAAIGRSVRAGITPEAEQTAE